MTDLHQATLNFDPISPVPLPPAYSRAIQRRREALDDARAAIAWHEAALRAHSRDDPERREHLSELAYWRGELARLNEEMEPLA